jgi:hypothetical protein
MIPDWNPNLSDGSIGSVWYVEGNSVSATCAVHLFTLIRDKYRSWTESLGAGKKIGGVGANGAFDEPKKWSRALINAINGCLELLSVPKITDSDLAGGLLNKSAYNKIIWLAFYATLSQTDGPSYSDIKSYGHIKFYIGMPILEKTGSKDASLWWGTSDPIPASLLSSLPASIRNSRFASSSASSSQGSGPSPSAPAPVIEPVSPDAVSANQKVQVSGGVSPIVIGLAVVSAGGVAWMIYEATKKKGRR